MISIAGTASAQTIPGTYIEIDDTNTQLQEAVPGIVDGEPVGTRFSSTESGGTEFFDAGGFVPLWEERMIELSEGGNAPFNTLGFTGNSGDLPIVTTLTGLQAGTYDVEFIFVGGFGFDNLQYQTGFTATTTSPIRDTFDFDNSGDPIATRYMDVDVSFPAGGGTFDVFGSPIGTATVGPDGELTVYTDLRDVNPSRNLSAFTGLSLVAVDAGDPGDFDGDGIYGCLDVDALVAEIAAGTNDAGFDLTGEGTVDSSDLTAWLAEAGAVNNANGNPFLPGDANLDGSVDASDFNVWNGNRFTSTAAWCSGDFNADGSVDGSDFNVWNSNKFTSSDGVHSVPEPGSLSLFGLALLFFAGFNRRK